VLGVRCQRTEDRCQKNYLQKIQPGLRKEKAGGPGCSNGWKREAGKHKKMHAAIEHPVVMLAGKRVRILDCGLRIDPNSMPRWQANYW